MNCFTRELRSREEKGNSRWRQRQAWLAHSFAARRLPRYEALFPKELPQVRRGSTTELTGLNTKRANTEENGRKSF